jgi:hypothetical protein
MNMNSRGHYSTLEEDEAAFALMEEFCREAGKIDTTQFSPRLQQAIKEYEAAVEVQRRASETDLDYLRRTQPDMTDKAHVCTLLWSIVAGKSIREEHIHA